MGKNKKHRKIIRSLERRIEEHKERIAKEKVSDNPDIGLVRHWEKEMDGWSKQVEHKRKRLPGRK